MHSLTSNRAILSIARSAGMEIVASGGEPDAYLRVPDHAELVAQLVSSRSHQDSAADLRA